MQDVSHTCKLQINMSLTVWPNGFASFTEFSKFHIIGQVTENARKMCNKKFTKCAKL